MLPLVKKAGEDPPITPHTVAAAVASGTGTVVSSTAPPHPTSSHSLRDGKIEPFTTRTTRRPLGSASRKPQSRCAVDASWRLATVRAVWQPCPAPQLAAHDARDEDSAQDGLAHCTRSKEQQAAAPRLPRSARPVPSACSPQAAPVNPDAPGWRARCELQAPLGHPRMPCVRA